MSVFVPVDALRAFAIRVLTHHGLPDEHAGIVTERLLDADMHGMGGHGVIRLPQYLARVEAGGYNLDPDIRVVRETTSSALVDGDNGFGQLVVSRATEIAIAKAADTGIAWVGVRASNHAGAAGVYAAMGLDHGMIGLYFAVGSSNHLPPWGGVEEMMSTNPLAVAIPAGDQPPIVLDMATTVVSAGRVKVAAARGETMPEGWVVDRAGNPITDPNRLHEGFLVPIGGYKGYGLGLVVGLLAGVLNGAAFGRSVVDFTEDHHTPANTGQTIVMVRPDLFRPFEEFIADMDTHLRDFRGSTPMEGWPPVRTPGDQLPDRRRAALEHGVELAPGVVASLTELAVRSGIDDHPFPSASAPAGGA
jgi:L-2-hydroxycarboxylate dehydrogenase (NAD+)